MISKIKQSIYSDSFKRIINPSIYLILDCFGAAVLYYIFYLTIIHLVLNDFSSEKLILYSATGGFALIFRLFVYGIGYDRYFAAGADITYKIRIKLANHMKSLGMGYFDKQGMGYLLNTLTGDICKFEGIITHAFPFFLRTCFLCLMMLTGTFFIDPILASIQLSVVFISVPVLFFAGKAMNKNGVKKRILMEDQISIVMEFINGIKVFQSFNMSEQSFTKMVKALEKMKLKSIETEKSLAVFSCIYGSITGIIFPLIFMVGGYQLINDNLNHTSYIAFLIMGVSLGVILSFFEHYYLMIKELLLAVKNINKIFKYPALPHKFNRLPDEIKKNPSIKFENVSFSYSKDKKIIQNISFKSPAGTKTALVGPSGSGKTTIVNLISRFYDIDEGQIKINNTHVKDINPDELLGIISQVFQENILFEDTIWNNVKIAKPEAGDSEIEKALCDACCDEFVKRLPNGYHSQLLQGGTGLSGGEKQRITIARAILKNAPILLLDESTASLDADNEVKINKILDKLMAEKTVFVIAHRLDTIKNSNQILLINNGKIEESGTHNSLMKQKGRYFKMVNLYEKSCNWKIKEEGIEI